MEVIAAFVLTGGRSTRIGSDKALLGLGGKALIARAVELAREVTPDVRIVGEASKYSGYGPTVGDVFQGHGPLAGIHAALRSSNSERNLVLAVDLPFLDVRFLNYLIAQAVASGATVTVPSTNDYFQPLCAVYRKQFADVAERALAEGRNKIDALFGDVTMCVITEVEMTANGFSAGMFRNLNTPEEWEKAEREFVREQ